MTSCEYKHLYSSVTQVSSETFRECFSSTFNGVSVSRRQPWRVNVSFLSFSSVYDTIASFLTTYNH